MRLIAGHRDDGRQYEPHNNRAGQNAPECSVHGSFHARIIPLWPAVCKNRRSVFRRIDSSSTIYYNPINAEHAEFTRCPLASERYMG